MKLKKSDINILLIALGIGIAAVAYFFVFTKFNEKTDVLKANNASLQQEVDRLQDLANNKQQYLDDTESMTAEIESIKSQFAAGYKPEDEILFVRELEKNFDTSVPTIAMPDSTIVEVAGAQPAAAPVDASADGTEEAVDATDAAVPADTADTSAVPADTADTSAAPTIALYQTQVTVSFQSSYNSIKDIIKLLNTDQLRKSIENLSMGFDSETGDLSGNLVFDMYSLTGTDAVYTTPEIPGVTFGTNNIFNSADKKVAIDAKKAEEAAADEAAEEDTKQN